jgi:uncharacterized protein (DUF433 family)
MEWIVSDPNICGGKPVVRGTRVMVRNILGMVAAGYDVDRILQAYPQLTPGQVAAALRYAARVIDAEKVVS